MSEASLQIKTNAERVQARYRWVPYTVLAVTALLTLFAARLTRAAYQEKAQAGFDSAVAETCRDIDGLMKQHLILLDG
ncbi:MAG TPA: hypothetical protein VD994_04355, partial [Prosthecobacter sp.]|nr:hypothetical protein [Prosthecobacter sp.]